MSTLTKKDQMLYCPKCKREYEDGSQRFCNSDGGRLQTVPEPGTRRPASGRGVFTSLLGRSPAPFENDERLPQSVLKREIKKPVAPTKGRVEKEKVFGSERVLAPDLATRREVPDSIAEEVPLLEIDPVQVAELPPPSINTPIPKVPVTKTTGSPGSKPMSRLIDPREIGSGRAPLGDRKTQPAGRNAFSSDKPHDLVGQVIKGRYKIFDILDQDSASTSYLAEDSILTGKQVVVRVLLKDMSASSIEEKIFQEERVSLSHVDHPNVAKVIDSGELPEGKPFIVTAESRDRSAADLINEANVEPARIARIVKQASHALSEIHQNGILHRNLKPDHILLTTVNSDSESVKVTDFCVSDGKVTAENFRYKAPEQIGGQLPTFSSDSYSLAVIAYQLLTNRLPFVGESPKVLIGLQKGGLSVFPSKLNDRLPSSVDAVFERALAFEPSERYPKSRDFGVALYDAICSDAIFEPAFVVPGVDEPEVRPDDLDREEPGITIDQEPIDEAPSEKVVERPASSQTAPVNPDFKTTPNEERIRKARQLSNESLWKNRSPEILQEKDFKWAILPALGILILLLGAFGIWQYFLNQAQNTADIAAASQSRQRAQQDQGVDSPVNSAKITESDIETPPPPRQVVAPPNSIYFENSKLTMNEKMVKKFLPFSLYYPESWKRKLFDKEQNKVDDKFVDIAISDKTGIPIEQLTIGPYESNGTFKADTELFATLVAKSNKDTSEALRPGSYEVISQGATTIQNGRWKAYQVNFESKGQVDGKPLTIWGRRLWIPIQRPGARTGFIITMLATSLSRDVKGADDVGKKGGLKQIVQTFEPIQEF